MELMPTKPVPLGIATASTTAPGRHRMCTSWPRRPLAIAIWSMMPHGAPTTRFSAICPSRARRAASKSRPRQAFSAESVPISTAAELATPAFIGTALNSNTSNPPRGRSFSSLSSANRLPAA